ncbi:hypothetical protein QF030_000277 [Streptomyces rishiriensis]|uniref:LTD domain-containing protein n=1 Tax=Streptomyces rishiriensis TaxID=68264 RepID=A0ABU0NG74_STRRH|nr:hypothetical protein [Streptomyces rishiriensis]
MRMRHTMAAVAAAGTIAVLTTGPAQATEYTSALKLKGVQYDAPGSDSNRCSGGNTKDEYLTIKNYSRTATVDLKGYVVKDATGNKFAGRRQARRCPSLQDSTGRDSIVLVHDGAVPCANSSHKAQNATACGAHSYRLPSGAVCAGSNPAGGTLHEVPKDPATSAFAEDEVLAYVQADAARSCPMSRSVDEAWTGSWSIAAGDVPK